MKKAMFVVACAAISLAIVSCGGSDSTSDADSPVPGLAVEISTPTNSIVVGKTVTLSTSVHNGDGKTISYTWYIDNTVVQGATSAKFDFTKSTSGIYTVKVIISDGTDTAQDTISLEVSEKTKTFVVDASWDTFGLSSDAVCCNCVAIGGGSIYVGTDTKGLIYSDDNGSTWNTLNKTLNNLANDQVYSIAVSGSQVYIGTFDGFSVWDRGASPATVTNYLPSTGVNKIAISGSKIYLATTNGVKYGDVTSLGSMSSYAASFDNNNVKDIVISGSSVYASGVPTSSGAMFVAGAGMASPSYFGPTSLQNGAIGVFHVSGQIIVAGNDFAIDRSADGGKTWTETQNDIGGTVTGFSSDGTYLYAVRNGGDLWYSFDTGMTWKSVVVPGFESLMGLVAWGVVCDSGYVYIAHSKGLVKGKIQ